MKRPSEHFDGDGDRSVINRLSDRLSEETTACPTDGLTGSVMHEHESSSRDRNVIKSMG
jgi:hypothetical protein